MPANSYRLNAQIALSLKMANVPSGCLSLSGVGGAMDPPASWSEEFSDVFEFANGRSTTGATLTEAIQTKADNAGEGGTWLAYIDKDDLVTIRRNGATAFTVEATNHNRTGFLVGSVTASTLVDGNHEAKAPLDWLRGLVEPGEIDLTIVRGAFTLFAGMPRHAQTLPEALKTHTRADNLATLAAAYAGADVDVYLNQDGLIVIDTADAGTLTLDTKIAEVLGFETETVHTPGVGYLAAQRPVTNLLQLDKGLSAYAFEHVGRSFVASDSAGRQEKTHINTRRFWTFSFALDTRVGENTFAAVNTWLHSLFEASIVTVYPNNQEYRLAGSELDGYSNTVCGEWHRRMGRNPLYLNASTDSASANPLLNLLQGYTGPVQLSGFEYVG